MTSGHYLMCANHGDCTVTVYAVVFGNYDPPEVGMLCRTRERAEFEADLLKSDQWHVVEMAVR